ncbi:MAG: type IX secretion system protein PorQ [Chitinophagaceae bacterium]
MRFFACLFFLNLFLVDVSAQTLGGTSTYNFLRMQWTPQANVLGGRNISLFNNDIGLYLDNPALLRESHHGNISANFTSIAPTIKGLFGTGAYYHERLNTTFAGGIAHLLYGNEIQTDAAGNIMGNFTAYDQMISIAASRQYEERWFYGANIKFINSRYGAYSSLGLAADIGINYYDEERMLQAGFAARNMGVQVKTYANQSEDLPFDLLLGVTKQLEKAPIRFSLTAQRLHQFDLLYNDQVFNIDNYGATVKNGFGSKILSHLIAGTDLIVGEKVVLSLGYNFLRRKELQIRNLASGLTGFGYGLRLNLNSLQFQYARTHYQSTYSQHQASIVYKLVNYEK